jgi:hypothetical protein
MTRAIVMLSRHQMGGVIDCIEVKELRRIADDIYRNNLDTLTDHVENWVRSTKYPKVSMHRRYDARDNYWKTLMYIKK